MTLAIKVLLFCLIGGAPMAMAGTNPTERLMAYGSGVVFAACFAPVMVYGPRTFLRRFGVMFAAFSIVTSLCTWSEALLFMPEAIKGKEAQALFGGLALYTVMALVFAGLAKLLRIEAESTAGESVCGIAAVPRILASGFSYIVYYFIFGALTFLLYTYRFYPDAAQQASQLGIWFWVIQFGRGTLMTLGMLPVIYSVRLPRGKLALVAGTVLWGIGGLAPLLLPGIPMGWPQRVAHIIEIFTQNFALGVTAAYLLKRKAAQSLSHAA